MARKLFYVAILLAILSQGLASQTQTNTTDCNAESCIFPERDSSQFCSESLTFLDCVKDNVVDNRECLPIQRAAGESVIFLGKYTMLLNDCKDVPGTYCDLKKCPTPMDQGDDVCLKVRAYQKCLVDEIIENNQCALFEKGAAVAKLVMTALNFTNCDEGEGQSWVEDNKNLPQAPIVLLNLVHNDTGTNHELRTEEKFKHFGAELCDKQLVNDQEPKPFGPEREEDVKVKPRPEGVEQDAESDDAEQDDERDEMEQDEGFEEELDESVELEEDESVVVEEDDSVVVEEDDSVVVEEDEIMEEELAESTEMKQDENVKAKQGGIVVDEQPWSVEMEQSETLSESGDVNQDCDENVPGDVEHFKADSDSREKSDKSVKAKQGVKQYKPVSYITGESMEEEIKRFKSCSFSNGGNTQEKTKPLQEGTDGDVDIRQEGLKQLNSDSNRADESSREDSEQLRQDSLTEDEATRADTQHIAREFNTMSIISIQTESDKTCAAESDPIPPPSHKTHLLG